MFNSQNNGQHVREGSSVCTASKIEELKAAIGPLSGRSLKYCTDGCLRGYLEVNNWNVKKAKKMLEHTLEWRSAYKPEEIRWHEVAKEGERGIMYRASFHDRQGRTVLVMRAGTAIQKISSVENMIRFNVYLLENAVLNFQQGQDQMAWLIDFTGWSLTKSMPIRLSREFISILQNHYPDRLAIAFLYNPPRAFEAFLKIIKYFLDNKTIEKAKFVYPKEKESVDLMKSYFDEENLPIEFGGKASMKYDHEEYSRLMTQDDLKSAAF
ncbi:phosphatidylinositol transfer protein 3 [Neltuma alba]|uniref:phosphatidylinositol transfer protein 3 n=1 Tax=Neltuma alba TaxID=207710 RepID=UPI0010A3B7D1|nr:phosphatidylinositol transfer protein 3-like [Prosopis alba]XP_028757736.1 phosphatidylinositol transfer protein 3-like [Prosopis alba]XP_028757737.1 phosphatidylinositol transfer protein 3-like [Prosopis alba]